MVTNVKSRTLAWLAGAAALAVCAMLAGPAAAQSKEPIKIGFSMAQTGPLGPNGKQALLGMQIWEEETNAKGGLLGRPVKLVYYDDQSNPSTVPGIYTKLLDVDKVDLVLGPYATNMVAPAMPIVIQRKKTFISLFALDVNHRVQIQELLLGAADRTEDQALVHRRLVPGRDAAESEADDGRAGRRGCGILQGRVRWRACEREGIQAQGRLRQELPAGHD